MMNIPKDLKYAQTHEWIRFEPDGRARIGITDYLQETLGDIVYVSLPHAGEEYAGRSIFADMESVKLERELYLPVPGRVVNVNMALMEQPQKVNEDPYGAWLIEIKTRDEGGAALMDAEGYGSYLESVGTSG